MSCVLRVRPMLADALDGVMTDEQGAFHTPWSRSAFEEELAQNRLARYLVALDGETIVGYAGTWLVINEAHVTNVAVHSDRRREGIGRLLMDALMNMAREEEME